MASVELKQSADDDIGKHLGSNLYICVCYDAKAIHQNMRLMRQMENLTGLFLNQRGIFA